MAKQSKKPSQIELLEQIKDLLIPVSNLAKFNIHQINQQIEMNKKQEEEAKLELEKDA